ncbi:MAG: NADPH-dependent 7-cyano-7-deazaguanine reductase QueF [Gammaproteobacteria bacterium]
MALTHLGEKSLYIQTYTPSLLEPIARTLSREMLGLHVGDTLPFYGADIWNAYEVSWLNEQGKPMVAIMECVVACTSPFLIESKSFKLYLNSFNQSRFPTMEAVRQIISQDLSAATGAPVDVIVAPLSDLQGNIHPTLPGESLDHLDVSPLPEDGPALLHTLPGKVVRETLTSDLLKSNCPVTGQPDWGSVQIQYTGQPIDRPTLLRYFIHFHQLQDFHEHCVERMFLDILHRCKPSALTVYARYTRRGGLDINPYRSTSSAVRMNNTRLVRQ